MKKSCVMVCALLLCASTAGADVISDWNRETGARIGAGARRGPSGALDFAVVHLAMHDAVQAFERRYQPYCIAIPNASGSSVAAASKAARDVLVGLFPLQTAAIDAAYASFNATYIRDGLMVADDPGASVGYEAAKCILDRRLDADNAKRATPDTFTGGTGAGEWRPTAAPPPPPAPPVPPAMAAEFLATVTPFAMNAPDQFRIANPPPALTSETYTTQYNEVKEKGSSDTTKRTTEEDQTARFFADGPANYWNRLLRDLVVSQSLDLGDSARMFALVSMVTADALIASWDCKIAYNFWRPVTAIRLGDDDGNPATAGEPGWTPYFNTPNYPDYTSGANNVSAATTTILESLLGHHVEFTLFSNTAGALPRPYTTFAQVARDVVDARVFMGIHFRFADTTARRQGSHVARWAYTRFLRPIGGSDN
jgi:hypothetical protein